MQIEPKEIQREVGITFVIVTHDQDEALTLCDRLAVFKDGRIEQVGAARDVYESPANRFVADFVGSSNVLDGSAAEALVGRRERSLCDRNASRSSGREPTPCLAFERWTRRCRKSSTPAPPRRSPRSLRRGLR
jgi:putative spermidine/putrescine transport system ATP-binding protein